MPETSDIKSKPRGPRSNLGAHVMAFLAILLALTAWMAAASAGSRATEANRIANQALQAARQAEKVTKNVQLQPNGGTGPNNPLPVTGNSPPNANGQ